MRAAVLDSMCRRGATCALGDGVVEPRYICDTPAKRRRPIRRRGDFFVGRRLAQAEYIYSRRSPLANRSSVGPDSRLRHLRQHTQPRRRFDVGEVGQARDALAARRTPRFDRAPFDARRARPGRRHVLGATGAPAARVLLLRVREWRRSEPHLPRAAPAAASPDVALARGRGQGRLASRSSPVALRGGAALDGGRRSEPSRSAAPPLGGAHAGAARARVSRRSVGDDVFRRTGGALRSSVADRPRERPMPSLPAICLGRRTNRASSRRFPSTRVDERPRTVAAASCAWCFAKRRKSPDRRPARDGDLVGVRVKVVVPVRGPGGGKVAQLRLERRGDGEVVLPRHVLATRVAAPARARRSKQTLGSRRSAVTGSRRAGAGTSSEAKRAALQHGHVECGPRAARPERAAPTRASCCRRQRTMHGVQKRADTASRARRPPRPPRRGRWRTDAARPRGRPRRARRRRRASQRVKATSGASSMVHCWGNARPVGAGRFTRRAPDRPCPVAHAAVSRRADATNTRRICAPREMRRAGGDHRRRGAP